MTDELQQTVQTPQLLFRLPDDQLVAIMAAMISDFGSDFSDFEHVEVNAAVRKAKLILEASRK